MKEKPLMSTDATCQQCAKKFQDNSKAQHAKYCGDACRMAHTRASVKAPLKLVVPIVAPPAPDHLTATGVRMWAELWELPHTTYADGFVIERYVTLQDRRAALLTSIGDDWTVPGAGDYLKLNPLVSLLRDTEAKLVPLEDRLGLNPLARARSATAPQAEPEVPSLLDDFIAPDSPNDG